MDLAGQVIGRSAHGAAGIVFAKDSSTAAN